MHRAPVVPPRWRLPGPIEAARQCTVAADEPAASAPAHATAHATAATATIGRDRSVILEFRYVVPACRARRRGRRRGTTYRAGGLAASSRVNAGRRARN